MRSIWPILVAAIVIAGFVYLVLWTETCELNPEGCSLSIGGFTLGK